MKIWEKIKEIGNRFLARSVVKISPKQMVAAMHFMARLKVHYGWCPEAAATAAAVAMIESGLNPGLEGDSTLLDTLSQIGSATSITPHGLFSWHGARFQGLQDFAAKVARHWTDFHTQIDYFNMERLSRSPLEKQWHGLTDLSDGCYAGYKFQMYVGPVQSKLEAYAEEFLFEWQGRPDW